MYYQIKGSEAKYEINSNKRLFELLTTWEYIQCDSDGFIIFKDCPKSKPKTYDEKKEALRYVAIDWQNSDDGDLTYYYSDYMDWQCFFYEMGKKYGLLTEFKENGIPC